MKMEKQKSQDKAEDEEKRPQTKKPPGWRNFQKVLKQVIKAPPMKGQGSVKA
jgi:hypothetical protein